MLFQALLFKPLPVHLCPQVSHRFLSRTVASPRMTNPCPATSRSVLPFPLPLNFASHCAINQKVAIHHIHYDKNWNRFSLCVSTGHMRQRKYQKWRIESLEQVGVERLGDALSGDPKSLPLHSTHVQCLAILIKCYKPTGQHKLQISHHLSLNQERKY